MHIDIVYIMSYNSIVKHLVWDEKKNEKLKKERGIGFEEAIGAIFGTGFIKIEKNQSSHHANQYVYVLNINNYGYLVPFVEDDEKIFLKTIIPSRKATKKYIEHYKTFKITYEKIQT